MATIRAARPLGALAALLLAACEPTPPPAQELVGEPWDAAGHLVAVMDDASLPASARMEAAARLADEHPDHAAVARARELEQALRASAPPRPADATAAAMQAALGRFAGQPGVGHAEWRKGDFVLGVVDNGRPWQPVADATCVWIRQQGYVGAFRVIVLEDAARRNQRWVELARARCA